MKALSITALFALFSLELFAQTNYSFPISNIIAAGATGIRLPNGTIVRAARVTTGTGVHSAVSGTSNPDGMGGTFTGTSFLPAYVGTTNRNYFTVIETSNTNTVSNGVSNNCANSIGFRIYFDRPTVKISFLGLDIDGANTNPGNAEWITGFGFNGTTYVPYTQIIAGTADPEATAPITINTTSAAHNWRTLITNTAGAGTAASLPNSMQIQRGAGGGLAPDNQLGQAVFTPTDPNAAVTDFYFLFGLWQQPPAANTQASGVSPIVVRVSPDFGDAPDTYQTLLATSGPSHGVVGTLGLGTVNNTKADGLPSAAANLDPDDDGVATVPIIANDGSLTEVIPTYTLTTTFFNSAGLVANYVAWIDWNNNGAFESGEAQTATSAAAATTGTVSFTWTNVTLSGAAGVANTYARIRVTTEAITTADVGGALRDGEVEDYLVPFSAVLPVKLIQFSGVLENNRVFLNWETNNEIDFSHFVIERSGNNANFSSIGQVNTNGGASGLYEFVDPSADFQGTENYFYRLRLVDLDRRQSYSPIVRIGSSRTVKFKADITPNPATSVINLTIEGLKEKGRIRLDILNSSGITVHSEQFSQTGTTIVRNITRPNAPAGIYFYRVTELSTNASASGRLVLR